MCTVTIGSIRLGSWLLTSPIRRLTGQQVIASDGNGASRALSWRGSDGSPSQVGHASDPRITGIRLCNSVNSWLGVVVTMAKLRTHSPAGERQFSHTPANAIRRRSASATAWGCFPSADFSLDTAGPKRRDRVIKVELLKAAMAKIILTQSAGPT